MAENSVDIKKIFWTNVDWHRKNKKLEWKDILLSHDRANNRPNVSLETVQRIAAALDIDDYAILFEEI